MTNNTDQPTAVDFKNVLPSSNKIIKTSRGYLTNCLNSTHDDNNPSMGIMDGDTQVIVKCFSRDCNKEGLLSYFYEKLPYYIKKKEEWEKSQEEWRKKQLQKAEEQRCR